MNTHDSKRSSLLPCYISLTTLCLAGALFSCNNTPRQEPKYADSAVLNNAQKPDNAAFVESADSLGEEYAIYYIVVADSGRNYYPLDAKMYELQRSLNWPVDTMNRHYDAAKKSIVLADDDEDEMYRGVYFPRRDASTTLSLEYYSFYSKTTDRANIALVTGIFDQRSSADSMQKILLPHAPRSFVSRAKVFTGCMH